MMSENVLKYEPHPPENEVITLRDAGPISRLDISSYLETLRDCTLRAFVSEEGDEKPIIFKHNRAPIESAGNFLVLHAVNEQDLLKVGGEVIKTITNGPHALIDQLRTQFICTYDINGYCLEFGILGTLIKRERKHNAIKSSGGNGQHADICAFQHLHCKFYESSPTIQRAIFGTLDNLKLYENMSGTNYKSNIVLHLKQTLGALFLSIPRYTTKPYNGHVRISENHSPIEDYLDIVNRLGL